MQAQQQQGRTQTTKGTTPDKNATKKQDPLNKGAQQDPLNKGVKIDPQTQNPTKDQPRKDSAGSCGCG